MDGASLVEPKTIVNISLVKIHPSGIFIADSVAWGQILGWGIWIYGEYSYKERVVSGGFNLLRLWHLLTITKQEINGTIIINK